jgi:hypothetical protein
VGADILAGRKANRIHLGRREPRERRPLCATNRRRQAAPVDPYACRFRGISRMVTGRAEDCLLALRRYWRSRLCRTRAERPGAQAHGGRMPLWRDRLSELDLGWTITGADRPLHPRWVDGYCRVFNGGRTEALPYGSTLGRRAGRLASGSISRSANFGLCPIFIMHPERPLSPKRMNSSYYSARRASIGLTDAARRAGR